MFLLRVQSGIQKIQNWYNFIKKVQGKRDRALAAGLAVYKESLPSLLYESKKEDLAAWITGSEPTCQLLLDGE